MELDGKHKLAYEWTFWFDKNSAPCNFELNLAKIGSFDTVLFLTYCFNMISLMVYYNVD